MKKKKRREKKKKMPMRIPQKIKKKDLYCKEIFYGCPETATPDQYLQEDREEVHEELRRPQRAKPRKNVASGRRRSRRCR
jgi:hypothetical protein